MALIAEQTWTAGEGRQDWLLKSVFVTKERQRDFCHVPLALLVGTELRLNFSKLL